MRLRRFCFAASLGVITAVMTLAACSDDGEGTPMTADLRLVHADASAGPVDLVIDGTTLIDDLAFGYTSAVTRVPGGVQHIIIRSGSTVITEVDAEISETELNSLLLSASGAQFADVVVPDTGAVATDRANIRMVNIVGSNTEDPNLLDVLVEATVPDTVMTFGLDTRIASYGTLMYFDPGPFTFTFQPDGESTVLAQVTFNVAAGETKDVVLERAANGAYTATVVVEE